MSQKAIQLASPHDQIDADFDGSRSAATSGQASYSSTLLWPGVLFQRDSHTEQTSPKTFDQVTDGDAGAAQAGATALDVGAKTIRPLQSVGVADRDVCISGKTEVVDGGSDRRHCPM
jgi:hypothetical protein